MRVLIAGRRAGQSGIRTYTDALAAGLCQRGHEVFLLDLSGEEGELPAAGVERVRLEPMPRGRVSWSRRGPLAGWASRDRVGALARDHAVDVVHVTHLALAPTHPAVTLTAWDPLMSPWARYRAASMRGEQRWEEVGYAIADAVACRRARAVIGVTTDVARAARAFGRPVHWIPPFVPDETVRAPDGDRPDRVLMIANGMDSERKGLELAVAAVARLRERRPGVTLTLVGRWSRPERQGALQDFCEVRGFVDRAQLLSELGDYGCCVVSSRWEEFGYGALEALAAGVPVACTPAIGLNDLAGHGVSVAGAREPGRLADALVSALDCETFTLPEMYRAGGALARIEEVYREISAES